MLTSRPISRQIHLSQPYEEYYLNTNGNRLWKKIHGYLARVAGLANSLKEKQEIFIGHFKVGKTNLSKDLCPPAIDITQFNINQVLETYLILSDSKIKYTNFFRTEPYRIRFWHNGSYCWSQVHDMLKTQLMLILLKDYCTHQENIRTKHASLSFSAYFKNRYTQKDQKLIRKLLQSKRKFFTLSKTDAEKCLEHLDDRAENIGGCHKDKLIEAQIIKYEKKAARLWPDYFIPRLQQGTSFGWTGNISKNYTVLP